MSCTKGKGCQASIHYSACPEYHPSRNDDATYNRSNLTVEEAMRLGFWERVPSERGDSMG
jgi:hypothetical protein